MQAFTNVSILDTLYFLKRSGVPNPLNIDASSRYQYYVGVRDGNAYYFTHKSDMTISEEIITLSEAKRIMEESKQSEPTEEDIKTRVNEITTPLYAAHEAGLNYDTQAVDLLIKRLAAVELRLEKREKSK